MSDTDEQTKISNGRLYVSFTVTGKDLNPDDLTASLGVKPSRSFKLGDVKKNSDGEQQIWQHGCWSLYSDERGLSPDDPRAHFEWLIGILEAVQDNLSEILANKNFSARASCFWVTPDGRINLEIDPEFLMRFAKLNIKIWFDIYCNH